ncbi:MAG: hypothetical protein KF824_12035 [Fimbriimonadaceae bacterium]|nr:MAG: hypothetical protein KF824_12035 [Fimbriimonadaceae bacterium]
MIKAVIDVGSNSTLLLVAQKHQTGWKTIYESSEITGLGAGTKKTHLLNEDAQLATLAAIRKAFESAQNLGAEEIICAGTMALRIANNSQQFLERAAEQKTPTMILSAEDEAQFGFLAVANDPLFAGEKRITIIDPGGHSTELQTAERTESGWMTLLRKSFSVGALGLIDGPMPSESPGFAERLAGVDLIDSTIGLEYLPHQCGTCVVLGATGTNMISIREKLATWQPDQVHGATLDFEEVSRSVSWLCDMTEAQRRSLVGIELGREKTIHLGNLILERFMQCVHALECRVSVRGWRYALLDYEPTS